jgi:hypothetical protein
MKLATITIALALIGTAGRVSLYQAEAHEPFVGNSQSFSLTLYVITPENWLEGAPTGPTAAGTRHSSGSAA